MIVNKIVVEITNIDVDRDYYSFEYLIKLDGEIVEEGEFSDSHVWYDDISGWREELEQGEALSIALGQYFN